MIVLSLSFSPSIPKDFIQSNFPTWMMGISVIPCVSLTSYPLEYTEKDILSVGEIIISRVSSALVKHRHEIEEYQKFVSSELGIENKNLISVKISYYYNMNKPSVSKEDERQDSILLSFSNKIKSFFSLGIKTKAIEEYDTEEENNFLLSTSKLINYNIPLSHWGITEDFLSTLSDNRKIVKESSINGNFQEEYQSVAELFLSVADIFAYRSIVSTATDFSEISEDDFSLSILSDGERGLIYE